MRHPLSFSILALVIGFQWLFSNKVGAQIPTGHGGPTLALLKLGDERKAAVGGEGMVYFWDRIGVGGFGYVAIGMGQTGDDFGSRSDVSNFGLGGVRLSVFNHFSDRLSIRLPVSYYGVRLTTRGGDRLNTSGFMVGLTGTYRVVEWLRAGVGYQRVLGKESGVLGGSIGEISLVFGGY